mgnify:CR=1 FL=1
MRAIQQIFIPARTIRLRTKPSRTKECFCLDSKEHPRMYKSLETLNQYMPEEFDSIYVFELKKVLIPKRDIMVNILE